MSLEQQFHLLHKSAFQHSQLCLEPTARSSFSKQVANIHSLPSKVNYKPNRSAQLGNRFLQANLLSWTHFAREKLEQKRSTVAIAVIFLSSELRTRCGPTLEKQLQKLNRPADNFSSRSGTSKTNDSSITAIFSSLNVSGWLYGCSNRT